MEGRKRRGGHGEIFMFGRVSCCIFLLLGGAGGVYHVLLFVTLLTLFCFIDSQPALVIASITTRDGCDV